MPFTQGHALLVGVGAYLHSPHMNVPITVADARAVAQVLCDPRFCGYPESQVTLLHDEAATSAGILAALDRLAANVGPDDTVVLFYCGHGDFADDGAYYLTSHETRVANKKVVGGTGVSQKALLEKLKALRAERVLVLFNACHSGAVAPTLGADAATDVMADGMSPLGDRSLPDETAAALLATGAGRIIITACREEQLSYVGAGKLTLFTQALVSGLLGQGLTGRNGFISAFDLYTHIYSSVSEKVKIDYQAVQEPELTILQGVGPFAVALYPGATALGAFEAQTLPTPGGATREVGEEESRRALERIINVGQGVAIGGDMTGGTVIGNLSNAQNFGEQHNVNTGGGSYVNTSGGDYAGGNIDKRQGRTFISGGVNNYGGAIIGYPTAPSLQQALVQMRQVTAQAQQRGDDDLADDLQSAIAPLEAALKAEQANKTERRAAKLEEARAALGRLAPTHPELAELAEALSRVG